MKFRETHTCQACATSSSTSELPPSSDLLMHTACTQGGTDSKNSKKMKKGTADVAALSQQGAQDAPASFAAP